VRIKQITLGIINLCGLDPSSNQYLMGAITSELERWRERVAGLEAALKALVEQLEEVHADKRYQSVWQMFYIHGGVYQGPSYANELKQAEAALSGGTSALDAVVAEATRKAEEERDALAAALERMATEFQRVIDEVAEKENGQSANVRECFDWGEQYLSARDARIRAEGAAEATRKYEDEKSVRLKYQDATYAACNALDLCLEERYTQADAESIKAAFQRLNEKRRVREDAVRAEGKREGLEEAYTISRGCHDYGGGYVGEKYDAYHHGMDTVGRVIQERLKGADDLQMRVVLSVGEAAQAGEVANAD